MADLSFADCKALFQLSDRGFLPQEPPLERFPGDARHPWDVAVDGMAARLRCQRHVRRYIEAVPEVGINDIARDQRCLTRAYLVLTYLASSYVWGELPPSTRIPRSKLPAAGVWTLSLRKAQLSVTRFWPVQTSPCRCVAWRSCCPCRQSWCTRRWR